jgi:hypothetical protein
MVYSSIRLGAYGKVRDFYGGGSRDGLTQKVLAGLTTGCFGIFIANPFDVDSSHKSQVIKVRY